MSFLIGTSAVLWIITWLAQGFNFSTVMSLVTTVMFCGRKVKYFCKPTVVVTMECLGIFLTVATQLLFHRFVLLETITVLLLRAAFIGILYYDTKLFVYVTEKRRKDNNEA